MGYEVTSNTGCPVDTTSEDMSMDMCPEMSCGCQPPMETVEYMDEMGCVRRCECGNDMYVMRDPENNCEFYPCEMETSMDIDFGTEGESMVCDGLESDEETIKCLKERVYALEEEASMLNEELDQTKATCDDHATRIERALGACAMDDDMSV